MTNYVYIATSIDGFIAGDNNELEWLNDLPNPDNDDFGFSEFIKDIDALVMGRNTFETVIGFGCPWPYAVPVFVLSNTLKDIPVDLQCKVEILKGDPAGIVSYLNTEGYHNLYIDGGKVIQSFLKADLIDEMIISIAPVFLGKGISLFSNDCNRLDFKHLATEKYANGLIKNRYGRVRS